MSRVSVSMNKTYELIVMDMQGFPVRFTFDSLEEAVKRSKDFYGDPFKIIEKIEKEVPVSVYKKVDKNIRSRV